MNAHDTDVGKRTVRLFRNGRSQAIRIPKELEFDGEEVLITPMGDGKLTIEAMSVKKRSPMLEWLDKNGPIPDFPGDPGDDDLLPLDDVEL